MRVLCLAAVAVSALWLARVRSVSIRHAVWTLTLGAMLLLPWITALLPDLPVRILPSRQSANAPTGVSSNIRFLPGDAVAPAGRQQARVLPSWQKAALAVYGLGLAVMLARLVVGCLLARRLVRSSKPQTDPRVRALIERHGGPPVVFESPRASVPMTTGALAPWILLPSGWREWGDDKLEASLAHELAHVRRRDPLVALVAAFNVCVFWFHPLAWWLERKLALLAEQAADDSALLAVGDRRGYASALLEMSSATRGGRRLAWGAYRWRAHLS